MGAVPASTGAIDPTGYSRDTLAIAIDLVFDAGVGQYPQRLLDRREHCFALYMDLGRS